jgi:hypothetical protein
MRINTSSAINQTLSFDVLQESHNWQCSADESSSYNEASLDIVNDATNAFKYHLTNDKTDLPSDGKVYEKLSSMQFIGTVSRVAWAVLKAHYTKTNNIAILSVLLDPRYNV